MQYTENLNLMKPDKDDKYLVDHMNGNSDTLDAAHMETRRYAEAKSSEALASAKSYASAQDEEVLSTANGYADTQAAGAVASANKYSDDQDATTLDTAKAYAEEQAEDSYDMAKTYADGIGASALSDAKGYTDTKSAGVLSDAKAYSDEIKQEMERGMGNAFVKKAISIPNTGWEKPAGSTHYTKKITDSSVDANTIVNINLNLASLAIATECELQAVVVSGAGFYNIYAVSVPSDAMEGTMTLQKEVS